MDNRIFEALEEIKKYRNNDEVILSILKILVCDAELGVIAQWAEHVNRLIKEV